MTTKLVVHQSEAQFQRAVIEYAQVMGWRVLHVRPAQRGDGRWLTPVAADGQGWPDLFMVRGDRAVAAELKSDKGRVTKAQQQWLDELADVPCIEAYLWRPDSWDDIEKALRR